MEREHTVSMSVTNGSECICNPEILFGTNYGLWNFEKEIAPRGTLLDLNAAWELFLSRKGLENLEFEELYHHLHEIIDGVVYEDGDTTYTLIDDKGNKTNATFTIKANKGPVEHIEWEKGYLYLYYTKTRPVTTEDKNSGVPLHYVYDENGAVVVDSDSGKPLIYDYVKIPVIEIFDNDETHSLFPWFADNLHTVRLRQNLDDDNPNGHLGDVAITTESEVFIAKERYPLNEENTLFSVLSAYELLKKDLGITPTFENVNDLVDTEGNSIHQRVNGSNLSEVLNTENTDSIIDAINETVSNNYDAIKLISGETVEEPIDDIPNFLLFNDYILNHNYPYKNGIRNLLWALNNLLHYDLGDFQDEINLNIKNSENNTVLNITEALNSIFKEAEDNKNRIGWDSKENKWIDLTTDKNSNLTEAINELDLHTDELAKIIQVKEKWDSVNKKTYYENPNLNTITKNRLRPVATNKNDTTIVEDINELQALIGNLDAGKSGVTSWTELTTDNKNTLVEAINEVDLHTDNNTSTLGAEYNVDAQGKKSGEISNLTTTNKNTIVEAINELDDRIGDLSDLNTDDKSDIVSAINETIAEAPFIYLDTNNSNSGVILKNQNNTAGEKSLIIGDNNTSGKNSFVTGTNNNATNDYNLVSGSGNNTRKNYSSIFGKGNNNDGNYNLINGENNSVKGDYNLVHGSKNKLNDSINSVVLGQNNEINCLNILAIGSDITVEKNTENSIGLGKELEIKGSDTIILGKSNISEKESVNIGINNESVGQKVGIVGFNNFVQGNNSFTFGNSDNIVGNNNYSVGEFNDITGNNNYIFGTNQTIEGNNNILIGNNSLDIKVDNSIIIGELENYHNNATHIGKDIYISTHDTESKLLSLIFIDLNDWCKKNNSSSLNGEKFLDTSHLVQALKVYLSKEYVDNALIRFKMQDNNENGIIIVQGKAKRVYLNGSWYFSDNIENGWSRHEGTYLKVITNKTVNNKGETITKSYLAFMDLLSTEAIVDTVGAQRSNTEDFKEIDLTHAYGAVDMDDFDKALDLKNRFNLKVDKYAQIITNYYDANGVLTPKVLNFIDPDNPDISANITLDLKKDFGFNPDNYQIKSEKGEPNGYVPLNAGGLIDAQYLPSYVDDVIDVWAEYEIDSKTGAVIDIHLYELESSVVPTTGLEIASKGKEILEGERGKIYVEANPSSERRFSAQFRWTGSLFVAIGFSNITIGQTEGTAFDGGVGQQLLDDFTDHINSGTTQIPVQTQDGETIWVTYKPNPHNVKAQQLDLVINDPNDPSNITLEERYIRDYNVATAILELFDRLNVTEDKVGEISLLIGTEAEINEFDELDDIQGNNSPTIIGTILSNLKKIDSFIPINDSIIEDTVKNYFKFFGDV